MGEQIRFIDLFSGIGGFRLGLERNGFKHVWSNDINKYANQVYTTRFGETGHHTGDIREIKASSIPDHDLICAGFPCQAFSVAGQRRGFKDTRGTLFFEIARIIEAKKPALCLLENVKGLLSHDEGLTFQVILESLEELGYFVEWQVLNSKHFGVPQNRERVFIVGHLREGGTKAVFPITETSTESNGRVSGKQVASALQSPGHAAGNYRGMNMIIDPYNGTIKADESGTIRTTQGTPTSMTPDKLKIFEGAKIRRLTPVECERLQGFPDGWTEGISDTRRYQCLGNAVTVNVIEYLGELIKSSFSTSKRSERNE